MPRLASVPEDFVVDELPLFAPDDEGEHTFVWVEKRLLTTEEVARELARAAGTRARDVGYAGRKDRVAVARQWFSVPGLPPEGALRIARGGLRVLEVRRHRHKLRTGALRGNRFDLVVREVEAGALDGAPERLAALVDRGLPNRFGAQRFGRDGRNAQLGREILAGGRVTRDRRAARFLLSALQAEVFNAVLARRADRLDGLESGDLAWIHATGRTFAVEDPAPERARLDAFEISATGPIFGTRTDAPRGAPGELEAAVFAELGVPDAGALRAPTPGALRAPAGIRLRGGRRPLRVRPGDASCEVVAPDALRLRFTLPAGSYATVLVEELLGVPALSVG